MDRILKFFLGVLLVQPLIANAQVVEKQVDLFRWAQFKGNPSGLMSFTRFETTTLPQFVALPMPLRASKYGDDGSRAMWASPLQEEIRVAKPQPDWPFQRVLTGQWEYPRIRVLTMGSFGYMAVGWNRLNTSILNRLKAAVTLGGSKPTSPVILVASPAGPARMTATDLATTATAPQPITLNWKLH